jgi:5-hydroxyisourate hydrolase
MSKITTHVLDAVLGKPASGIDIRLDARQGDTWMNVVSGVTDADGRCRDLAQNAGAGVYRLTFFTGPYLKSSSRTSIYPEVAITFVCNGSEHYHLPLLLSDNSYTTYRGS